jgi:hypothetical protein
MGSLGTICSHPGLRTLSENACQGLSITPGQLHQELEAGGDLFDVACGALASKALWLTATTLALMRYPPENDTRPWSQGGGQVPSFTGFKLRIQSR